MGWKLNLADQPTSPANSILMSEKSGQAWLDRRTLVAAAYTFAGLRFLFHPLNFRLNFGEGSENITFMKIKQIKIISSIAKLHVKVFHKSTPIHNF